MWENPARRRTAGAESGSFRLDIKERFFPHSVAGHWNRLPRAAPGPTELKGHLDNTLRHRGTFWGVLCRVKSWTRSLFF